MSSASNFIMNADGMTTTCTEDIQLCSVFLKEHSDKILFCTVIRTQLLCLQIKYISVCDINIPWYN